MRNHQELALPLRGVLPLHRFPEATEAEGLQRRFLLRVRPVRGLGLRNLHGHQEAVSSGGASSVATATGASASAASPSPSADREPGRSSDRAAPRPPRGGAGGSGRPSSPSPG